MRSRPPIALVFAAWAATAAAQETPQAAVFRASRDLVSIDVVVRDRAGAIVRDLSAADFDLREDGQPQRITTTSFQEVGRGPMPVMQAPLLQRLGMPPAGAAAAGDLPDTAGRRLVIMLFDLSGMEPEEVDRGVTAAMRYVDTRMTDADLVAVASLTWELRLLTDFTSSRDTLRAELQRLVAVDVSTGGPAGDAGGVEEPQTAGEPVAETDARLRALRLLADAVSAVPQKKALLYFTAGLGNVAQDTLTELRAASTAAARANLAVYPVDTRGLTTVIPSGPARTGSRADEGLFSGDAVNDQFVALTTSQDTMASLAAATGGALFSGRNDLGGAFDRMTRDTSAYYLLGYSSTNAAADGRFRRVQVRIRREGLRVEARTGYYADRDFAHTGRADREVQLEEQLMNPSASPALAVSTSTDWSQLAPDVFRVGVAVTSAVQPPGPGDSGLDVLAVVQDEQGRVVARVRDTMELPPADSDRPMPLVRYTTAVVLPPGRYLLKSVVRENEGGAIGNAFAEIRLPHLRADALTIAPPRLDEADAPALITEVYGAADTGGAPLVAGAALFDGPVPRIDQELVEITTDQDRRRGARVYRMPLQAMTLRPGAYTCQITVVDPATGRFATMRSVVDVP